MADGDRFTRGGRGVFLFVVLAVAAVVGVPGAGGGGGALAMAGGNSVGGGIRGGAALRLGLRVDGTRHSGAGRSAAAAGSSGVLPLRAESYVRGLRCRLDRAVGDFWTCQPGGDCRGGGGC